VCGWCFVVLCLCLCLCLFVLFCFVFLFVLCVFGLFSCCVRGFAGVWARFARRACRGWARFARRVAFVGVFLVGLFPVGLFGLLSPVVPRCAFF